MTSLIKLFDHVTIFIAVKIYISKHVRINESIVCVHRLCGLVVRVLGYRSGGPGSIPGTNREKK
jgi:hypothetical protein